MQEQVVPTPGYGPASGRHERRSGAARCRDEASTAEEVVDDPRDWKPSRNDLRGLDTERERRVRSVDHPAYPGDDAQYHHGPEAEDAWHAAEQLGTVAPIQGRPSLDPANGSLVSVSYLAGYSGEASVGYDSLQGVDRMVTGEADATRDLRVESNTPGSPLQMGAAESVFSDDVGAGTHGLGMTPEEDPANRDWCSCLKMDPGEGWL